MTDGVSEWVKGSKIHGGASVPQTSDIKFFNHSNFFFFFQFHICIRIRHPHYYIIMKGAGIFPRLSTQFKRGDIIGCIQGGGNNANLLRRWSGAALHYNMYMVKKDLYSSYYRINYILEKNILRTKGKSTKSWLRLYVYALESVKVKDINAEHYGC